MAKLEVPGRLRRGARQADAAASMQSALQLLDLLARELGVADLGDIDLLDMGCGTKLVEALLLHELPMGSYTGIDVYSDMIDFLQREIIDPRFSFHHMDTHHENYNPRGEPLNSGLGLPCEPGDFDCICLFSVFTHLAPHDYSEMLKLLRPYIRPEGKLIFSLFVNETTEGGHGLIDDISRKIDQGKPHEKLTEVPDFVDMVPTKPLKFALYSRPFARQLVDGTGWRIEALKDPEEAIQHYMVCRPI